MDVKVYLKDGLKAVPGKALAGAFSVEDRGPRSRDVRVTHPNGSRLSSALTNGALSWLQRTEDGGGGRRGRGEKGGECASGRIGCLGLGGAPGDWDQIARENRAVT